jgi:hypothetical protein
MTLAECIAKYETVQAQPINARTSGLTPLGHAVAAASRLKKALEPLPAEEHTHVLALLAELQPVVA